MGGTVAMATGGAAPHEAAAGRSDQEAWRDANVVPMHGAAGTDGAADEAADRRAPARGVLLGSAIAIFMWIVALYVAFKAVSGR